MKLRDIGLAAIILALVFAVLFPLSCLVQQKWVPIETTVHAAEQAPDPWKGLDRGWGILTLVNERAEVLITGGRYQILNNNIGKRRSPLPIPGDVVKMERDVEIEILDYATKRFERALEFPGGGRPTPSQQTGIAIPAGTPLLIDQVRMHRIHDVLYVWALIKKQ